MSRPCINIVCWIAVKTLIFGGHRSHNTSPKLLPPPFPLPPCPPHPPVHHHHLTFIPATSVPGCALLLLPDSTPPECYSSSATKTATSDRHLWVLMPLGVLSHTEQSCGTLKILREWLRVTPKSRSLKMLCVSLLTSSPSLENISPQVVRTLRQPCWNAPVARS